MPSLSEKPCATSHVLYKTISLFSFCFLTKIHLYPTGITPLGVWTIGPNTLLFASEFNSVWIVFFHIGQSFLYQHSSTVYGLISSLLLVMLKETLNKNTLFMIILFWSKISYVWTYIVYEDLIIFRYLDLFRRCLFRRSLFNRINIERWFWHNIYCLFYGWWIFRSIIIYLL